MLNVYRSLYVNFCTCQNSKLYKNTFLARENKDKYIFLVWKKQFYAHMCLSKYKSCSRFTLFFRENH